MNPTVAAALITSTASIIVALIGLVAAFISLKESNNKESKKSPTARRKSTVSGPKTTTPQQSVTPSEKKSKIQVIIRISSLVVIGLIIGGVLGYFIAVPVALSPCGLFAPTSVTITSPASDNKVSSQITVLGAACHITQDKELWLFVTVQDVNGYFPQANDATHPSPITVESGGTWSVYATLGTSADSGKTFTLIPALVDQNDKAAKDDIQKYFEQFKQPGGVSIVPIEPLPSGIQLMSPVSVLRT